MNGTTKNTAPSYKVARYGWEVLDEPGQFTMLPKVELMIDPEYQRDLIESKVTRIAAEWSWMACGALVVADREGVYFVIDGQHRLAAAQKREDIQVVPCLLFETTSKKEEAQGFVSLNTARKLPSSLETHRARLTAEDEDAIRVEQLVTRYGWQIGSSEGARTVRCVSSLYGLAKRDFQVLQTVWPIACRICADTVMSRDLLEGLCFIEARMAEGSLAQSKWQKRLYGLGHGRLLDGIHRATAFRAQRTEKTFAEGVLLALNKGLHQKLTLPGMSD